MRFLTNISCLATFLILLSPLLVIADVVPNNPDITKLIRLRDNLVLQSSATAKARKKLEACVGGFNLSESEREYADSKQAWRACVNGPWGCDDVAKEGLCRTEGEYGGLKHVSASVCKDRCNCYFGYGDCNGR
jgi:hypothetical protein